MRIFGKGFNFSQDGPGNRLVYHLSGCNMHCIWCSNPEGMDFKSGYDVDKDDIVEEILNSKMMFFSGGGVTFTGGEATLQFDELLYVLKKMKENNIHTTLETNGTSKRLNELLPYIDYLIMDFKHYDSDILKKYTNVGNEITKMNYERICAISRQQHIRIPLINNINANNPERYAEYFMQFDTSNTVFEFIPYHEYGKDKWTEKYLVENGFVDKNILDLFIFTFEKYNLKIVRT